MTKRVRIENADNSNFGVLVEVWDKGQNGEPDRIAFTRDLRNPTEMTGDEMFITSTRYIVIRELPPMPPAPSAPAPLSPTPQ